MTDPPRRSTVRGPDPFLQLARNPNVDIPVRFHPVEQLGAMPVPCEPVAERYYIKPTDDEFFAALDWLRKQYGLGK
jgi:hypothetical protein